MGVRKFNPTTPSRRNMTTVSDQAELTTKGSNKPEKSLVRAMSKQGRT